eukprot:4371655-Pyramimonas_sp.AAC.1
MASEHSQKAFVQTVQAAAAGWETPTVSRTPDLEASAADLEKEVRSPITCRASVLDYTLVRGIRVAPDHTGSIG